MVQNLARTHGVRHWAIDVPHAPGCMIDKLRSKNCTADANPSACRKGVKKALGLFALNSVLNCNVTVNVGRLQSIVSTAANHTTRPLSNAPNLTTKNQLRSNRVQDADAENRT